MKFSKTGLLISLSLTLFSFLYLPGRASALPQTDSKRLIVKFRKFTPGFLRDRAVSGQSAYISENLLLHDTYIVNPTKDRAIEVIKELKKNLFVEYVEEDYIAEAQAVPNDPMYGDQWGLAKMNAEGGWEVTKGSNSVDVAVIDTGVNQSHPDLTSKVYVSVNCIYPSCPNYSAYDPNGHGTHVAGIVTANTNNNVGIAGAVWDTRIFSVKVLDDSGRGYYSWIANGIVWAADHGAEVINLSLAGTSSSDTLRDAVEYAWNKGVVIVAAAGNSGNTSYRYPAFYDKTIAVAASDQNDVKATFSNYGMWVDVAAPGVSILSTYKSGYEYLSGTSMSVPYVSGLAALIKTQHPGWSNQEVRNKIESSSKSIEGTGTNWSYGRIDICSALDCSGAVAVSPTAIPTPTPTSIPTSTPTPTVQPTVTVSPTPSPVVSPTQSPSPIVSPTPTPTPTPTVTKPWWCSYAPWHYRCQ